MLILETAVNVLLFAYIGVLIRLYTSTTEDNDL